MRTNEDHFSSLVLMRTKSSIEDLYRSTRYTAKIQVSVYNQTLQNLKMVPFVGEQSLCTLCVQCALTLYTLCNSQGLHVV